jgi:pimeloyl-ACP methyl ester carboxylesterase
MSGLLYGLSLLAVLGADPEMRFVQVAPAVGETLVRTPDRARAVVLIHGLHIHTLADGKVPQADFASWQQPGSLLVKTLAQDSDVFAFSYGQTVPVDVIPKLPNLRNGLHALCELGYREVVLVGHSAGGLVVRQLVEDDPECGVTKVVQVCAPNVGSAWAVLKNGVCRSQKTFVGSLTKKERSLLLQERAAKQIPEAVQFVCVVGTGLVTGDGLVSTRSQWPEDLQQQGIPAVPIGTAHAFAVRGSKGVKLLAELVREPQPRWSPDQVRAMRKRLWGVMALGN